MSTRLKVWWRIAGHCSMKHVLLESGALACGRRIPTWLEMCPTTLSNLKTCQGCTKALEKYPGMLVKRA